MTKEVFGFAFFWVGTSFEHFLVNELVKLATLSGQLLDEPKKIYQENVEISIFFEKMANPISCMTPSGQPLHVLRGQWFLRIFAGAVFTNLKKTITGTWQCRNLVYSVARLVSKARSAGKSWREVQERFFIKMSWLPALSLSSATRPREYSWD